MAAFYGDKYTAAYTDGDRVSPAFAGGTLHVISDTYEATGEAAGSTFVMGAAKLPKNAVIVFAMLQFDALSTSRTLALSDGTADIISAASAASAGELFMDADYLGTAVAERSDLTITLAGGTATGSIQAVVFYTIA